MAEIFEEKPGAVLSANTVKHYLRLVSAILNTAVYWQYIPANPVRRVKMPRLDAGEKLCLDREQAEHTLLLLEQEPIIYRTAVTVLLMTGMRRGELLALRWADVDFDHDVIDIKATAQYISGQGLVYRQQTKTVSSTRVIKVPGAAMAALRAYRQEKDRSLAPLGAVVEDGEYIFTSLDGTALRPDSLSGWFRSFVRRSGLPPIHLHSLRHTNATLLIGMQMPITVVSGNLGHSNPNTTTRIYTHALKNASAIAADAMDGLFPPPKAR